MKISIVIITYQKLDSLRGVLDNLERLEFPQQDFEVVVVDDGSQDGTLEFLASASPTYRLRSGRGEHRGRAAARNVGCRLAEGRLVVMLDDDCLMHPASLDYLWRAHLQHPDRMLLSPVPHIAVRFVPQVLDRVRTGDLDFAELESMAPSDSEYALEELTRQMLRDINRFAVSWLAGQAGSTAFPAETFDRLGGYDEQIKTYGMEDFDFAYRFVNQGGSFTAVPESRLFHLDHGHPKKTHFKESTVSTRYFFKKFRDRPEIVLFIKFLCGAISFREFNNGAAEVRGMPGIEGLDVRFSPYGMISYRDQQLDGDQQLDSDREREPEDAELSYSAGQDLRAKFLLRKLTRDLAQGGDELASLPAYSLFPARRVVVVAPHMDDEVIGCGGLIQAYRKSGSQVAVVFLTDGAARNLKPAEIDGIRRARRAESEAAAATLGISECLYLDLPERELAAATAEPEPLAGALAEQRPDVILIPADDEYHPDHRAAHRWTRSVVDHLGLASRIVCYEVWGNCRPNRILALDEETWDRNVSAMKTYRTQLREMDYCRIMSFVRETRGRSAFPGTGRKAEVFRVLEPGEAAA